MLVSEAVASRRSVRGFRPDPVDGEVIPANAVRSRRARVDDFATFRGV